MDIPAFDPRPQNEPLLAEIKDALAGVLDSGRFIGGPVLERFEVEFARVAGAAHAVGVSSGTDALLAALMALDVGPGDAVLTTPFTFFATVGVVHRLGARPAFADIDPETFDLDPERARAALSGPPPGAATRWRVLLPVHLYGQPADLPALCDLAGARDVALLEDCAQATGAMVDDRPVGPWGAAGCFSFYPTKNLSGVGEGGMVVTDDPQLAERLRRVRNHGQCDSYHHDSVGGNFRLDALQAAALLCKLGHLPAWNAERRRIAGRYGDGLASAGLAGQLRPPVTAPGRFHVYNQYVVRVQERDALRRFLAERGIGTGVYYPQALHLQPCFAHLGHQAGEFPEAERACAEVLALPMYPGLDLAQVDQVVAAIAEFFGG